jgi:hypothetical protein
MAGEYGRSGRGATRNQVAIIIIEIDIPVEQCYGCLNSINKMPINQ